MFFKDLVLAIQIINRIIIVFVKFKISYYMALFDHFVIFSIFIFALFFNLN
jgi:hypothetical protein